MSAKIILLEGIDGAGKSTIIRNLTSIFDAEGSSGFVFDKHSITFEDDFEELRASYIKKLIWEIDRIPPKRYQKTEAYLKFLLLCSWYAVIYQRLSDLILRNNLDYILLDGWAHRHIIKTSYRMKQQPSALMEVVNPIIQGLRIDHHIFIEVDPKETFERKHYQDHECGYTDGLNHLDKRTAYVAYQTAISSHFKDSFPYFHIINNGLGSTPDTTAREVYSVISG